MWGPGALRTPGSPGLDTQAVLGQSRREACPPRPPLATAPLPQDWGEDWLQIPEGCRGHTKRPVWGEVPTRRRFWCPPQVRGWAEAGARGVHLCPASPTTARPSPHTLWAPDRLGVALWPRGDSSGPVPPAPSSELGPQSRPGLGSRVLLGSGAQAPARPSALGSPPQAPLALLCAPTSHLCSGCVLLLTSDF